MKPLSKKIGEKIGTEIKTIDNVSEKSSNSSDKFSDTEHNADTSYNNLDAMLFLKPLKLKAAPATSFLRVC